MVASIRSGGSEGRDADVDGRPVAAARQRASGRERPASQHRAVESARGARSCGDLPRAPCRSTRGRCHSGPGCRGPIGRAGIHPGEPPADALGRSPIPDIWAVDVIEPVRDLVADRRGVCGSDRGRSLARPGRCRRSADRNCRHVGSRYGLAGACVVGRGGTPPEASRRNGGALDGPAHPRKREDRPLPR